MAIIKDRVALGRVSQPTTVEECRAERVFENLVEELEACPIKGVGLSAIQIGIQRRACIMKVNKADMLKMVNPAIVNTWETVTNTGEGCLSFPGVYVDTDRFAGCIVEWTDGETGEKRSGSFEGIEAICIQHEIDHMDGVVIYDRRYVAKPKVGRNDPCPCNSGVKFKKCCGK